MNSPQSHELLSIHDVSLICSVQFHQSIGKLHQMVACSSRGTAPPWKIQGLRKTGPSHGGLESIDFPDFQMVVMLTPREINGWFHLRIRAPWNRKIIFQTIIFRFYVNLRGCIILLIFITKKMRENDPI